MRYLQVSTRSWRHAGRALAGPVSQRVASPVYRWVAQHGGSRRSGAEADRVPPVAPPTKGLRRRRSRDLGACARLLRVVFSEGQYPLVWPEAPRGWLAADDVIDAWVVERQGEILGHVAVSTVGSDPVSALRWREVTGLEPSELMAVSRLFVRPRVRGQGIGSALLDVAVTEIHRRGLLPVLEVASSSADAIRLCERRGWRLLAMHPWGSRTDRRRIHYYATTGSDSR